MKIQQQTTNNIEPIEVEASLKYRCSCGIDHWAYLREVSVEGFFIVCFCNNILYPKTIKSVGIEYAEPEPIKKTESAEKPDMQDIDTSVPRDILDRCCGSMMKLGFTLKEAKESLTKAYKHEEYLSDKELIKLALLEK